MKNINKYFAVIILILAGIATSCEKHLDIPQQGVQNIDDFYKTDDQALSALADVYVDWRNLLYGTHTPGIYLEYMSGDSYPGWANQGDNSGMANAHYSFIFDGDGVRSPTFYTNPAGMIRRVNTILARVEPDSPAKRRILAECRVIRAWAYSFLAFFYSNVPLFDEEITSTNAARPATPVAEIWAFVNRDFETAINSGDLPSKSSIDDKDNVLRVTKEAAQAFYGKMLLWQERWSEAATQLKAVINSGKYRLLTDAELLNHNGVPDFGYVIRATTSLGPESVLILNSKPDQNGNSGPGAHGGGFAWRGDQLTHNGGSFVYVPEYDMVGNANGGLGGTKKTLYDEFIEIEGPDGFRLKGSILTWEDFQSVGLGINGQYYCTEGYWDYKWRRLRSESGSWTWGTGRESPFNPQRVMRYAEVLLTAAEACFRSGDAASALTYVNMIRERAHLAPLASVTLAHIKKEKRLELYKEGFRYIDLVRWEKLNDPDGITAFNVLGEQGHYIPNFDGVTVNDRFLIQTQYGWKKGKHELMPIPVLELNANPNLSQNPGW